MWVAIEISLKSLLFFKRYKAGPAICADRHEQIIWGEKPEIANRDIDYINDSMYFLLPTWNFRIWCLLAIHHDEKTFLEQSG